MTTGSRAGTGASSWSPRRPLDRLAWRHLSPELRARLGALPIADGGHGWDVFGMSRGGIARALASTAWLYERYFRVRSTDAHHIPDHGGAVLVSNHSGTLPLDGMMIWQDVVRHSDPPRVPRVILDYFVNAIPYVAPFFTGAGGSSSWEDSASAAAFFLPRPFLAGAGACSS